MLFAMCLINSIIHIEFIKLVAFIKLVELSILSFFGKELNKFNKANSTNLYPPKKGYFRETCKSQNINPIYLTLSSPTVSFRS